MENRVREFRNRRNLTQEELAQRIDVTRQTIGLIESGRYNPTLKLCVAIAKALEATLDEVFWMEEDNHVQKKKDQR